MPNEPLAINADLIRRYAAGATEDGIRSLITIFDAQRRNMLRAEDLCRAAWSHATKLETKMAETNRPETKPATGASRQSPVVSRQSPVARKPTPQPSTGMDLGDDDELDGEP